MNKEHARRKAMQYLQWADKADLKKASLQESFYSRYGQFDWSEPIKLGHHSQRRHERVFEARDRFFRTVIELEQKAKRFREKASNLEAFANRNKGDAEKARQTIRDSNDKAIMAGTRISDPCYGAGTVLKVNTKTYTVEFDRGLKCTRDKSYVRVM